MPVFDELAELAREPVLRPIIEDLATHYPDLTGSSSSPLAQMSRAFNQMPPPLVAWAIRALKPDG